MPTDMDIIRELEEEIGGKLRKEDVIMEDIVGYLGIPEKGGYCVDSKGHVTSLILESLFSGIFPLSVLKLVNLVHLSVHDNRLTALPPEITQLTNLRFLYLSRNELKSLPPEITQLTNLRKLKLGDNQLSTLPLEIAQLKNLKELSLNHNQLSTLPPEIAQLKNLKYLYLDDNPLKQPPPEIVEQGIPAIFEYLSRAAKVTINEAKLILVGQGDVGKTCLAERLINGTFEEQESTEGIDIFSWGINAPTEKREEIKLNVWDFGGQEIYHSTHQFFLTKRSLYLLVWNARKSKDYDHIEYWLHTIEAFGEDSPIILVLSKCNEREDDLNLKNLRDRFPNIVGLYKVDSKDGTGIDQLKQIICEQSWALPHMKTGWIDSWLNVRRRLEADERNWIEYDEFRTISESEGLDINQTGIVDAYLHDLGVIIHFSDRVELKNMVILKPDWATSAVYKVLDTDSVRQRGGVLLHSELEEVWDTDTYPASIHPRLLKLMERFELAYELPDKKSHLVAELLPSTTAEFEWDESDNLRFYYEYDFLPPGVMPRFIVGVHEDLENDSEGNPLQWREGAVLQREDARAFVQSKRLEKTVEIRICGPFNKKRELLAIVRRQLDHINSSIRNVKIEQMIPCNCSKDCPHKFNYQQLLMAEKKSRKQVDCTVSWEEVSLSSLLDGYERKEDRMDDEEKTKYGHHTEYHDHSVHFNAPFEGSALAIGSDNVKQDISFPPELTNLFQQMIEVLKADSELSAEKMEKHQANIENLRQELSSKSPSQQVVDKYLSRLGSVASLASLANQVAPFLPLLIKAGG
jgi:small GTP-binding protein